MMNNFPLIHTVRTACSVDETVLCTVVRTAVVGPAPFSPFFAVFYTVQNV